METGEYEGNKSPNKDFGENCTQGIQGKLTMLVHLELRVRDQRWLRDALADVWYLMQCWMEAVTVKECMAWSPGQWCLELGVLGNDCIVRFSD